MGELPADGPSSTEPFGPVGGGTADIDGTEPGHSRPGAVRAVGPEAPAGPPPAAMPTVTSEALVEAMQIALATVTVEVDLGPVEQLVADSLRAAVAEMAPGLPVPPAVVDGEPAPGELEASPGPDPAPALIPAEPEVVEAARRVAASILSPAELAETVVFRLRPLLEDLERAARPAGDDPNAAELAALRAEVGALRERLDRRDRAVDDLAEQLAVTRRGMADMTERIASGIDQLGGTMERLGQEVRRRRQAPIRARRIDDGDPDDEGGGSPTLRVVSPGVSSTGR